MASSWAAKLIQYGGKNWGAPTLPDSMGDSFDEGAQGPATIEDVDPDLYLQLLFKVVHVVNEKTLEYAADMTC
jgi:hypothetical protein